MQQGLKHPNTNIRRLKLLLLLLPLLIQLLLNSNVVKDDITNENEMKKVK
jgi:hypothetical protein